MVGLVIGILIVIFFVGMFIYARKYQQRIKVDAAGIRTWAADHGYQFAESDDETWTNRWHFVPFGIGDRQHAKNVVSGQYRNQSFWAFDYSFYIRAGDQYTNISYALLVIQLSGDPPWVDVREGHRHALQHADKDEFTIGDDAFDDKYRVHADNEAFARAFLTESTRGLLPQLRLDGMHIVDGRLWAWRERSHNNPEELAARLDALVSVASSLPAH